MNAAAIREHSALRNGSALQRPSGGWSWREPPFGTGSSGRLTEAFCVAGLGVAVFGGYFPNVAGLGARGRRLAPDQEVSCASLVRRLTTPHRHCTSLPATGAGLRSAVRRVPGQLSGRPSSFHRRRDRMSPCAAPRVVGWRVTSPVPPNDQGTRRTCSPVDESSLPAQPGGGDSVVGVPARSGLERSTHPHQRGPDLSWAERVVHELPVSPSRGRGKLHDTYHRHREVV